MATFTVFNTIWNMNAMQTQKANSLLKSKYQNIFKCVWLRAAQLIERK